MESAVKKSLLAPIKTLKYCVSGEKKRPSWGKRGSKHQGSKVRTCAPRVHHVQEPHLLRPYQAELDRERKLREAMNAQKNAERAAMRAHFRRKYQLTKNAKDVEQLRAVGGKVCLSGHLARMVRPDAAAKDDGFSLIRAFRGLRFSGPMFTGGKQTKRPAGSSEPCRVM